MMAGSRHDSRWCEVVWVVREAGFTGRAVTYSMLPERGVETEARRYCEPASED
jgi:hypothetical protein